MIMRRAGEYPKLSEHLGREAVLWQHALDGLHHDKFGLLEPHVSELAVFLTTDVTREGHILSRFFFLPVRTTLLALMTTTKSPVSTWGV